MCRFRPGCKQQKTDRDERVDARSSHSVSGNAVPPDLAEYWLKLGNRCIGVRKSPLSGWNDQKNECWDLQLGCPDINDTRQDSQESCTLPQGYTKPFWQKSVRKCWRRCDGVEDNCQSDEDKYRTEPNQNKSPIAQSLTDAWWLVVSTQGTLLKSTAISLQR